MCELRPQPDSDAASGRLVAKTLSSVAGAAGGFCLQCTELVRFVADEPRSNVLNVPSRTVRAAPARSWRT